MNTQQVFSTGHTDADSEVGTAERRRLLGLAYRLLGSLTDAEDVVQETYARWYAMPRGERDGIDSPPAWRMTVAGRICLDMLRSARVRRESYVGEWIPEPLPDGRQMVGGCSFGSTGDPADHVTLDESITMAFLVILESMTPAERVAFVLHDVFGFKFAEVAEIVGRSPAACRQLASSARRRLRGSQVTNSPAPRSAQILRRFKEAWEAKDIEGLITVLDPDATAVADGGGLVSAERQPLHGAQRIARYLVDLIGRAPDLAIAERMVNGQPGLVLQQGGVTGTVAAIQVTAGRITHIWAVRNPEKLRHWP